MNLFKKKTTLVYLSIFLKKKIGLVTFSNKLTSNKRFSQWLSSVPMPRKHFLQRTFFHITVKYLYLILIPESENYHCCLNSVLSSSAPFWFCQLALTSFMGKWKSAQILQCTRCLVSSAFFRLQPFPDFHDLASFKDYRPVPFVKYSSIWIYPVTIHP